MNVHSLARRMPLAARRLQAVKAGAAAPDKRDAILRAATKVFAQNGYFQSQVADVARVAGVAAGTVYLYFKSKDDLLVSIFERSMSEVLAEGRSRCRVWLTPESACGCWRISTSIAWAATRISRWCSRWSCGSR